jgi:hypothetical protein
MDEAKRKAAPANPTVLWRGGQALALSEHELEVVLDYRTVRVRWQPAHADRAARGWREVLARWRASFDISVWKTLAERLPQHAATVLAAMRRIPTDLPQDEDGLNALSAKLATVRCQHLTFAVLCAAVDALGSIVLADRGEEPEPHGAYALLAETPEFKNFHKVRKRLWKLKNPDAYREMIAKSNARPSAVMARRRYMRAKRQNPAWADAERARRRAGYAARKSRAA